ncbi:unnamed protein product [Ambrosiozyma monospora]|uniref:Unnamed protein product n=1 Tax=Ambrosiozyma monospora TaxID=43982 RepID=A0ACB5SU42_AMBMO|nr:unnamed protein product [Ambrosiozyma monospora]
MQKSMSTPSETTTLKIVKRATRSRQRVALIDEVVIQDALNDKPSNSISSPENDAEAQARMSNDASTSRDEESWFNLPQILKAQT